MFYAREDRDQRVKIRWLEFQTQVEKKKNNGRKKRRNGENGGSPFINDNMSRYTGKEWDRVTKELY